MSKILDIKEVTTIYDELSKVISPLAKQHSSFTQYQRETARIFEKNSLILNTDIIGKQLLINKNDEEAVLKRLNMNTKQVELAYENSLYFQQFEKELRRKSMFLFVLPQLVYVIELLRAKKTEQARYVFFSAYLKPYASRVSVFFPHGVNEGQMRYTIENVLNNSTKLKKLGSVYQTLLDTSNTVFNGYKDRLEKNPTDSLLYDIIVSGISTNVSSILKGIAGKYFECAGKYAEFERTMATNNDGDEFEIEINSDAAVKSHAIKKTMMKIVTQSVDDRVVTISYKLGFKMNGKESRTNFTKTRNAVINIIKNNRDDIERMYDSLLNVFLYHDQDGRGNNNTARDIRSPKLLQTALLIAKASNNKNPNINVVKDSMRSFLKDNSFDYINSRSDSEKRNLEKSCILYFTIMLQQNG